MKTNDGVARARCDEQYELNDVLDALEDGDVLFASGAQLLSSVVKRLTHGAYSHCGLVVRWNGRPMLLHADVSAGVQATLLSTALARYARGFDWFSPRPEVRASMDARALVDEAQAHLGLKYNLGEVVHAGAHVLLGAPAPSVPRLPSPTHCSAYVARCFRSAGLALRDAPDNLVSPDQLSRSPALILRGSIYCEGTVERAPRRGWKTMADAIMNKALSLLPPSIREPVARAREMETLLAKGDASIATLTPRLRAIYEPRLRRALADAERARAAAEAELEAFESGLASEADVALAASRWSDDVARVLWQKVDEGQDAYAETLEVEAAE